MQAADTVPVQYSSRLMDDQFKWMSIADTAQ